MRRLADIASLIRSKNAGPFVLTFDIMFDDQASYELVRDSGALTGERLEKLYGVAPGRGRFFVCENARAFKFSITRPITQGDLGDGDMHGGQQFAPLMNIEIPGSD